MSEDAGLLHERGRRHWRMGRLAEAEADLRRALALSAGQNPSTRQALGVVLLARGRWREGWALVEARHDVASLRKGRPDFGFPQWQGEDLAGRRLLIVREEGLGDMIMYARFAARARDQGAQVTLLTAPPLVRLLSTIEGVEVLPAQGATEIPAADLWVMSSSLAGCFGATPETLSGAPYLTAEPRALPGGGRIGVVTRGNPNHVNDAHRSLTPEQAKALLATPGAVSLLPEDTGFTDFYQTAQAIMALERVITVDTAVAHLAGALGKPVEILLPSEGVDWRWLSGRTDTPWYDSARLAPSARLADQTGPARS
jgi:hypothetical protein